MNRRILTITLIFSLALFSISAHADIAGTNILDGVLNTYKKSVSGWSGAIKDKADFLFWSLATISMVWTFGMLHLRNAGIGEFFGELVRFSVSLGFFKWLLDKSPQMPVDIINSMMTLGSSAAGISGLSSPSGIVDIGFELAAIAIKKSSIWSPIDSIVGMILTAVILVVLALVGVNMLLLLISGLFVSYAGIFVLGFGGSRWTSDIAINYYKTVLNIGIQTMAMILLIGIGQNFINQYYANIGESFQLQDVFVLLVAAVILLQLTNKIPSLLGGLVMGGGTHSLAQGLGTSSAIAAMGAAASAFTAGTEMLKSGGANMIGGSQALMAAYQKASADIGGGGGASMSAMSTMQDGNSNSDSTQSSLTQAAKTMGIDASDGGLSSSGLGQSSQSQGAGSEANGRQGKLGGSVASTLAKGAKRVIGDKIQSRVGQSVAGQMATAIRNMDVPKQTEQEFGENSLSGPSTEPTSTTGVAETSQFADEIAAFVNRGV